MEVPVITVRLRYSPSRALANINATEFDPARHLRVEEVEETEVELPPEATPAPAGASPAPRRANPRRGAQ